MEWIVLGTAPVGEPHRYGRDRDFVLNGHGLRGREWEKPFRVPVQPRRSAQDDGGLFAVRLWWSHRLSHNAADPAIRDTKS